MNPKRPTVEVWRRLLLIAAFASACSQPAALVGTELDMRPAPDFTLTDALTGQGKRCQPFVALAFLYTHCPDSCPLTAEHFREAQKALGPDAARSSSSLCRSIRPTTHRRASAPSRPITARAQTGTT